MKNTFEIEELDRALFNHLRRKVVELGYLPNVEDYQYTGGSKAYAEDKKALDNCIEIFGVGGAESREERKAHKIVLNRKSSAVGSLGGFPATEFVPYKVGDETKFRKQYLPDSNKDIVYEIRGITNSTTFERIIYSIIYSVFGTRRYLKSFKNLSEENDKVFLITSTGDVDVSSAELRERLFSFVLRDVWVEEPTLIRDNIPQLTTVIMKPQFVNFGYDFEAIETIVDDTNNLIIDTSEQKILSLQELDSRIEDIEEEFNWSITEGEAEQDFDNA